MINLVDEICDCFENKNYAAASFLDLSMVFDCVSHAVLLRKLYSYNLHPESCGLISSYLKNR